jgi:hypothetical protein
MLVIVVLAGLGVFALVFVGRAVSCARFNRALRSYEPPVERLPMSPSLDAGLETNVVHAFRRPRRDSTTVGQPRDGGRRSA